MKINQQILPVPQFSNNRASKWNIIDGLAPFYKKITKDNLEMGDQGQSLSQFLASKGIQPNEEGTGRVSFSDIKKVECLLILKQGGPKKNKRQYQGLKKKITFLITSFLRIPSEFLPYSLSCEDNKITDRIRNLEYQIKINKLRYDALQILDLLTQYKSQSSLLVAFIQNDLHEHGSGVYGRACGDGVAIIDLTIASDNTQLPCFYETLLHETLHTLGFDHCLQSACLMNPIVAGDLWICPSCLKKLDSELQLEMVEWASELNNFYSKEMKQNKKLLAKSEKIVNYLKSKTN